MAFSYCSLANMLLAAAEHFNQAFVINVNSVLKKLTRRGRKSGSWRTAVTSGESKAVGHNLKQDYPCRDSCTTQ